MVTFEQVFGPVCISNPNAKNTGIKISEMPYGEYIFKLRNGKELDESVFANFGFWQLGTNLNSAYYDNGQPFYGTIVQSYNKEESPMDIISMTKKEPK